MRLSIPALFSHERSRERLLTTQLIASQPRCLTLTSCFLAHRLTLSRRCLTLTSQLIAMSSLSDSVVAPDTAVQVVEVQTGPLQLLTERLELVLCQVTCTRRLGQVAPKQTHGPAHVVHLACGKTARALKLAQASLDTLKAPPEPVSTLRRLTIRLSHPADITVHAVHALTDLSELAPGHVTDSDCERNVVGHVTPPG